MTFKHLFLIAVAISYPATFSSCVSEDKDTDNEWLPEFNDFNEQGYWNDCYDTSHTYVDINGLRFSHAASVYEWDGVKYSSWYGFCPSKATDNDDYSGADWTMHQWSSITGGGVAGANSPYVIGFWKTDGGESSCKITLSDGSVFYPDDLYVTNTSYGYYAMKNGTAFNRAFTSNDSCVLCINGYLDGARKTDTVYVYLAHGTDILDNWEKVEISKLGNVDTLVFTLTSTDTGQWGMNNPAYFCIGSMRYTRIG